MKEPDSHSSSNSESKPSHVDNDTLARVKAELDKTREELEDQIDSFARLEQWVMEVQASLAAHSSLVKQLTSAKNIEKSVPVPRASKTATEDSDSALEQGLSPPPLSGREKLRKRNSDRLNDFLNQSDILDFTPARRPRVGIALVCFNQADLSLACLTSLQHCVSIPFELVVIDNASTDSTDLLLNRIKGAKVIRNHKNLHFLRATNQAAKLVNAEYLLLLNNNTLMQEGAIEAALDVFESEPSVGAVGGKLIRPDGTLQEAGCIVWDDGVTKGYGVGNDPEAPEFNFRREVNYCSAAFLLTPKDLFLKMGGFDKRFIPAFYEDVDYCLRLKEKGFSVMYEPEASITHIEYGSSVCSDEAVALMQNNQKILQDIHSEQLSGFYKEENTSDLTARFASPERPKVLYIEDQVPHPELGCGFPRSKEIVDILTGLRFDVTLIPLQNPDHDTYETAHDVISPRVEVIKGCGRHSLQSFLTSRKGYFDVCWVSRPGNMSLIDHCFNNDPSLKENLHVVYDAEAVFALRDKAQKELAGVPLSNEILQRKLDREIKSTRYADRLVSVNPAEERLLRNHRDNIPSIVISHAVESKPTPASFEERRDLLFFGNLEYDDSPNVHSILWFVEHVWSSLREKIPGIQFHIVGRSGANSLAEITAPGITWHGEVESLHGWCNRCRVFIAPTQFSAGIPLKVIEAASYGIPSVVTENLGCQLGWEEDVEVCVARTDGGELPEAFASQVSRLYTNKTLWTAVRNGGLDRIRIDHSRDNIRERVLEALNI